MHHLMQFLNSFGVSHESLHDYCIFPNQNVGSSKAGTISSTSLYHTDQGLGVELREWDAKALFSTNIELQNCSVKVVSAKYR